MARGSKDASQARRLLALAVIYNGGTRSETALLAALRCRLFGTGWCGSMPRVARGCMTANPHVRSHL